VAHAFVWLAASVAANPSQILSETIDRAAYAERTSIQNARVHASVQQTQRYLNVTDEELRKGLEVSWKRRTLKALSGGQNG
jgi:hypothetical protein